jgi:hypothetical protein
MAGSQISTSITIIDSLHGYLALSLTDYNTSAAASIAAGSVVEIAGAFFNFPADELIEASTWTAIATGNTAYIALTASGTAGSQVVTATYAATAPTWRDDLQGWYASAASTVRVVGSVYKAEATNYAKKKILKTLLNQYDIPGSNWDSALNIPLGINWSSSLQEDAYVSYSLGTATPGSYILPGFGGLGVGPINAPSSATAITGMEYKIPFSGTVTVKFQLKDTNTNGINAQIYKNGIAAGTLRNTSSAAFVTYSEDISVTRGDIIKLYWYSTLVDQSYIGNFAICTNGYGAVYS